MASTKIYGKFSFECDGCGEELKTGEDNWFEALSFMKHTDWAVVPDGHGGWRHLCPDCKLEAA